ncbi:hypothetical protein GCM10007388_15770 [Pseudoduganella plicata]|nr:hypothetical protein GCM10007388_15770 [Pseudoduganella plicata]
MGKSGTSGGSNGGTTGSSRDMQQRPMQDGLPDVWQDGATQGNSAMLDEQGTMRSVPVAADVRAGSHPNWRATVLAIEPLSRQEAGMGIGLGGSPAAAAVGGTVAGLGTAGNTVYRVTLRGQDGRSHHVIVENPPVYQAGDQVTFADGAIKSE